MARRLIQGAVPCLLLAAAIWAVTSLHLSAVAFAQEDPGRAALVVRFADGSVQTQCISFSEPSITGMDLLMRSGSQAQVDSNSGLGGAVCSIGGHGCAFPVQDCFCRCQGNECEYWAYYNWTDGRWQYSPIGAGSYRVTDGALEGWSWGPGNYSSGTEPPQVTFDQVCAPDALAVSPGLASAEDSQRSVGSFLVPAVHAQDTSAARAVPVESVASASAHAALLPSYAIYLLLAAALTGAARWVIDRKGKAAAIAASARRRS